MLLASSHLCQLLTAGEHCTARKIWGNHPVVKLLLTSDPEILRSGDTPDPGSDPRRDEHFKSFPSSSSQRGEVVCQMQA